MRAGDIDVIWVYGYGFPSWRGGPMHYANTVGLAHVCDRLEEFEALTGDAATSRRRCWRSSLRKGRGLSRFA